MASPQLENGHSRIAHELLEAIYRSHPSSNELCILLSIIRHSYGWGKKSSEMAVSYLAKDTQLSERSVSYALACLKSRNMIVREGSETGIQKDYSKWGGCNPLQGCNALQGATHCIESMQPIAGVGVQPIAPKKERLKEKRKKEVPPKERSVLTECRDFSFTDFTARMGQKPAWATKDYVQLSALFKRLPDLTFKEWGQRWKRFASSDDPFHSKQGMSLAYFCSNFDQFIKDIPKLSPTRFQNWDSQRSYELLMADATPEEKDDKTRVS